MRLFHKHAYFGNTPWEMQVFRAINNLTLKLNATFYYLQYFICYNYLNKTISYATFYCIQVASKTLKIHVSYFLVSTHM